MYPCRQEPDAETLEKLDQLSKFIRDELEEFIIPVPSHQPAYRFTRKLAVLSVKRYELILHHIRQPSLRPKQGSLETDRAFLLSVEVLDYMNEMLTTSWAWQFYGFIQWQPLVLVLSRLSLAQFDTMAEHAWSVVTRAINLLPRFITKEPLFKPLRNLIRCVKQRRLQQLEIQSLTAGRALRDPVAGTHLAYSSRTVPSDLDRTEEDSLPSTAPNFSLEISNDVKEYLWPEVPGISQSFLGSYSQSILPTDANDLDTGIRNETMNSTIPRGNGHLQEALKETEWHDQGTAGAPYQQVQTDEWNEMFTTEGQSTLWGHWGQWML